MKKRITIIPGDGIGPEIMQAALRMLDSLDCNLEYDMQIAGLNAIQAGYPLIPEETFNSIKRNGIALKGPLTTPVDERVSSPNVMLRKKLNLYANVRPVMSRNGIVSKYENINLITVRENTEGMYSQEKQTVSKDGEIAESLSVITRKGSSRIIRFAYNMAMQEGRNKVAVVHKANILQSTSRMFLEVSRNIRREYPKIETEEFIVDNMCMQLVLHPEKFDVIVATNLFGDIISDLCAGLVGGLGIAPGANIGDTVSIFEAVHGSAQDIAGQGIANPLALILASAMMLDRLHLTEHAQRIRNGVNQLISDGDRLTQDLGGSVTTEQMTDALIERI